MRATTSNGAAGRSAARFDPERGSALAWILTLAHRRAVDRVRSARAASERDQRVGRRADEPAFDQVAEAVEAGVERDWVRRCLHGLSQLQRQSVALAHYKASRSIWGAANGARERACADGGRGAPGLVSGGPGTARPAREGADRRTHDTAGDATGGGGMAAVTRAWV